MSERVEGAKWPRGLTRRQFVGGLGAAASGIALAGLSGLRGPVDAAASNHRVRFAVIGDSGTADQVQYEVAGEIARAHRKKPLDLIVMAGDNVYPNGTRQYFADRFERPYESLLDAGIPFQAVLGNHDVIAGTDDQLAYPLFNMNGQRYRSLRLGESLFEFFFLDSNEPDDDQVAWFDAALEASNALWRVVVMHHPIFSAATTYPPYERLIRKVQPVLELRRPPVVITGHDHMYQRLVPQDDVRYFVSGGAGDVREGALDYTSPKLARGFDRDGHFMLFEADSQRLKFRAVSARGEIVDKGRLRAPAGVSESA